METSETQHLTWMLQFILVYGYTTNVGCQTLYWHQVDCQDGITKEYHPRTLASLATQLTTRPTILDIISILTSTIMATTTEPTTINSNTSGSLPSKEPGRLWARETPYHPWPNLSTICTSQLKDSRVSIENIRLTESISLLHSSF